MPIRVLAPNVVNQIAAGEVIERPASVVKELVENSLDSGATRIEVEIEAGGRDLIRVTDDGSGIPFEELGLALTSHATSKIEDAEDLAGVATMGFRGEALASIGSISQVSMTSRPRDVAEAGTVDASGDLPGAPRPVAAPPGTTVTVRHLFFNTPARRRFMRAARTEGERIREVVRDLALANPQVAFALHADGKAKFDLPAADATARAHKLLGPELAESLIEADGEEGGVRVRGLIGTPQLARPTARHLHVVLNGRVIKDKTIIHAAKEGYRGLIEPGRTPTAVLFLEIDPERVDVNVHPAKAEVRFRDRDAVHGAVRHIIRAALDRENLVPSFDFRSPPPAAPAHTPEFGTGTRPGGMPRSAPVVETGPAGPRGFPYQPVRAAIAEDDGQRSTAAMVEPTPLPVPQRAVDILQVHDSFVVTQDAEGLLIIDQHALHERVMFEKLLERIGRGTLESQQLLVPAVIDAGAERFEALERVMPMFERLGIEAAPLGPNAIGVHAFTTLLFERKVDPVTFVGDLLDRTGSGDWPADDEAALHEVLDMMACKAAIKAGDRLAPDELAELLALRERTERSSRCPHGRPTTLRISIEELERRFGR